MEACRLESSHLNRLEKLLLCVFVCGRCAHGTAHVQKPEDNFQEFVLPLHHGVWGPIPGH